MILNVPLASLVGTLFLCASSGSDPTAGVVVGAESAAPIVIVAGEAEGAVSGSPARRSRVTGEVRAVPNHQPPRKQNRSEELWWPSPDARFSFIFGDCGVRSCCRYCVRGKPCGNTCISRDFTCRLEDPCGCACRRPLFLSKVNEG